MIILELICVTWILVIKASYVLWKTPHCSRCVHHSRFPSHKEVTCATVSRASADRIDVICKLPVREGSRSLVHLLKGENKVGIYLPQLLYSVQQTRGVYSSKHGTT